jgi:hypothetical protein
MDKEGSEKKPADPKVWDKPRKFIITVRINKKAATENDEKK